jgi:hypothetical protein
MVLPLARQKVNAESFCARFCNHFRNSTTQKIPVASVDQTKFDAEFFPAEWSGAEVNFISKFAYQW